MSLLKWKKSEKENDWVTLYGTVLKNRLRRDKNLADLTDKTEAKRNLGLLGDVPDHNHDGRYMPMLQRISDDLSRETEARTTWETNFDQEIHANVEAQVENVIQQYGASINTEATKREEKDNELKQLIEQNTMDFNEKLDEAEKARDKVLSAAKGYVEDERSQREAAIMEEAASREKGDEDVKKLVKQEADDRNVAIKAERKKIDEAIKKAADEVSSQITAEKTARELAVFQEATNRDIAINDGTKQLKTDVEALKRIDIDGKIKEKVDILKEYVDKLFSNLYVGTVGPKSPVNNQTIWFYTGNGEESIRVFKDNRWITFGASYL